MGRNTYLRHSVVCASCGWEGIRATIDKPCSRCGGALEPKSGAGGRTFDQRIRSVPKKKASTFGTEYTAGQGKGTAGDRIFAAAEAKRTVAPAGLTTGEIAMDGAPASGTSIFDPVLCELAYRWFCPPGGTILDPFAGGSVRGIVAAMLGREYVGCDLRAEQIEANRAQAEKICRDVVPTWHVGDSQDIASIAEGTEADFIFSCPPYADLEVYSDDPRDLSTMDYGEFRAAYDRIIAAACSLLKPNRFACFVVGDVRDKHGCYLNFPGHTIEAFEKAGLRLYNEAILVTAAGSLPIRAGKQFSTTRKLGKTHQNIYVFVKGDPKKATEAIGEVEFGDIEAPPVEAIVTGDELFGEPL